MSAKWVFPLTNGGKEDGFNDPGVNTFAGDFEKYVAREAIQNVLDAKRADAKDVRIRFDLQSINASEIPGYGELEHIIVSCRDYYPSDAKAKQFFDHAIELLKKKKVSVLSIRDFNTTGLIGADSDRDSNWYSMIRSVGSSQKANDAGGSFGIGKNAPFAASALRTVFYSTKLADGSVAFQGVGRLVTHAIEKDKPTQGTGYFGGVGKNNYPCSIREEAQIPAVFRREQQGTDIHILAYMGSADWKKQLERAALEHFWPAISWGNLIVEIGDDIVINKETLAARMNSARSESAIEGSVYSGFNEAAYAYYEAFTAADRHERTEKLHHLKEVHAYFRVGDVSLPNQIAMVRRTGMVIYKHSSFRGLRVRYAGVFVCDNEVGNTKLRNMEPPRHDEWDVNRPEKGASRLVRDEYQRWLRKTLVDLMPKVEAKVLEVDELADYLPDTVSADGSRGKGEATADGADGLTDKPSDVQEPQIIVSATPPPKKPNPTPGGNPGPSSDEPAINGDEDIVDDDGPQPGPGPKDPPVDPKPNPAPQPIAKPKRAAQLFRKGYADSKTGEYIIFLQANQEATVNVVINAVGEDAFTEEIKLLSARDTVTGQQLNLAGTKIEGVALQPDQPKRVAVTFQDSARRAVTIVTNEV